MKNLLLLVALFLTSNVLATPITINFEDPSDINKFDSQLSNPFDILPNTGVNGSAALNGIFQGVYRQAIDFSQLGTQIVVSSFFKTESAFNLPPTWAPPFLALSLFKGQDNQFYYNDAVEVSVSQSATKSDVYGGLFSANNGPQESFYEELSQPMLAFDNWYEFSVTFTNFGNKVGFNLALSDFGANGAQRVSTLLNSNFIEPDLFGITKDDSVYVGVYNSFISETIDNFSIRTAQISEPSSLSLLIISLFGLGVIRRR